MLYRKDLGSAGLVLQVVQPVQPGASHMMHALSDGVICQEGALQWHWHAVAK